MISPRTVTETGDFSFGGTPSARTRSPGPLADLAIARA